MSEGVTGAASSAEPGTEREQRRADRLAWRNALLREQLDETASRTAFGERQIEHLTDRLNETLSQVGELEKEVTEQTYWRSYTTWQLDSVRASRWHRLGEALANARKRGVRTLPGALRSALRGQARPKVPQRGEVPQTIPLGPADLLLADVPPTSIPEGPINRPHLTVAGIMDTFTATALRYEWRQLVDFGPDDWRDVLAGERIDLLFVESAWQGNGGRWQNHLGGRGAPSQALRDLVAWCRDQGVPTVLWNKEDPPNFIKFVHTAKLFDWVFTVDEGSVPRYREELGHDRVRVLQFGAQPRVHNPIRVPGQGTYDVAFAGTYYTEKHSVRREQMEIVVRPALAFGVHIFSRVDHTDERFAFPSDFLPHIVGSLPYEKMLSAQKLYKVVLNVNTVVDSPTMCARRAFELSAAGIPVLSGDGRAVSETFGDLIPTVHSSEETAATLRTLLENPELRDRQAHLAMRLVLSEHTYAHRVSTVLRTVGLPDDRPWPTVSVVAVASGAGQAGHLIEQTARQLTRPGQLVLVLSEPGLDPTVAERKAREAGIGEVLVLTGPVGASPGELLAAGIERADGRFVAMLGGDAVYGPHYLSDLLHVFDYSEAEGAGKLAHYVHTPATGATALRYADREHRYASALTPGTLLLPRDLLRAYRMPFGADPETGLCHALTADGVRLYGADRFSFVAIRNQAGSSFRPAQDERIVFFGPSEAHVLI